MGQKGGGARGMDIVFKATYRSIRPDDGPHDLQAAENQYRSASQS